MNQKEYELLKGVIGRTQIISSMDKNAVRRQASNKILNLLLTDLVATLEYEYRSFDKDKFLEGLR